MKKSRPCVVVSPDEMHRNVRTVIVVPMTTAARHYPNRVRCEFAGKKGEIACDPIRAVDQTRLIKRLGRLDSATAAKVARGLVRIFS